MGVRKMTSMSKLADQILSALCEQLKDGKRQKLIFDAAVKNYGIVLFPAGGDPCLDYYLKHGIFFLAVDVLRWARTNDGHVPCNGLSRALQTLRDQFNETIDPNMYRNLKLWLIEYAELPGNTHKLAQHIRKHPDFKERGDKVLLYTTLTNLPIGIFWNVVFFTNTD